MSSPNAWHLRMALRCLRGGGVLAYPTEGVWGLGCDPFDEAAVQRLLFLKGRDPRKGLILVAGDLGQVAPWLQRLDTGRREQIEATWPGPVTWVLPDPGLVPPLVRGDHDSIALRVTAHPQLARLCQLYGGPIVSTSANPAGRPAARSALRVRSYFGARLDYLLPGALGGARGPSSIRDARSGRVLRAATPSLPHPGVQA